MDDSEEVGAELNGKISNVPSKIGKPKNMAQIADLDQSKTIQFKNRTFLFYGTEEISDLQATRISKALKTMKIARKS